MINDYDFSHLSEDDKRDYREQVNSHLEEYLSIHYGINNPRRKNFTCPLCGHKNKARVYTNDEGKDIVRCFSGSGCNGKNYDLLDLIGHEKGMTNGDDQLKVGMDIYGIIPTVSGEGPNSQGAKANSGNVRKDQPKKDQQPKGADDQKKKYPPEGIAQFVKQSADGLEGSRAADYMTRRGFDLSFLKEMRIGYNEYGDAVVIPYSIKPNPKFDYYTMRWLKPKPDESGKLIRYYKLSDITEPVFHAENIANGMPYVFVTEGQIDALSIEQAGGNAVALGSTNNVKKLTALIEEQEEKDPSYRTKKTFVISFDHDTAGMSAEKELIAKLMNSGYMAISANDAGLYEYTEAMKKYEAEKMERERKEGLEPKPIKDINEILQADPEALTARIEKLISRPEDVYRDSFSMGSFRSNYLKQRELNRKQPHISTGFAQLDKALDGGIRPTLIFIGAITSIGKSTLVMQIADYIAKQGNDVLIFALEMSRFELVSRSISRESYRIAKAMQTPQPGNALTYYEIADGMELTPAKYAILQQAEEYYFNKIAPRIFIIEGEGDITTEAIRKQVQTHTELTGRAPVVIVDYLQLLQPPKGANRWSDKQIVDHNTVAMKHISRDFSTPVIGVISLNRDAYNRDVDLASGKESGAIEYGCDILLGMNLEKEYADGKRDIYLDTLKHRGGKTGYRVTFRYEPAYSSFRDGELIKLQKKKKKDDEAATAENVRKGERDSKGYMRI